MVFCKAVALAAIVCVSIDNGARIKAGSKRIIEEQPLVDQLSRTASAASNSHDDELNTDELLALDDRVMPAMASVPATTLQMATRSRERKAPKVPATARAFVQATATRRRSDITKRARATPPSLLSPALALASLKHSFAGALRRRRLTGAEAPEVGQNRVATNAEEEEMLFGNSSSYALELELDKVDHSEAEPGLDIDELLSFMANGLEGELDDSLVRQVDESMEDLRGLDDIDFEETMQQFEEKRCTKFVRSGADMKRKQLEECCKVARIWSNCDHGKRFLANMLRRFNQLCKRFPSLARHRIAKAASLQDLGLLWTATGQGSGSGIGKWLRGNLLQSGRLQSSSSPVGKAKDTSCVGDLARLPAAKLRKCCTDNDLDATGTLPVLVARLKAHGFGSTKGKVARLKAHALKAKYLAKRREDKEEGWDSRRRRWRLEQNPETNSEDG